MNNSLVYQLSKHAADIDAALEQAKINRPTFFKMVCETPNLALVTKMLDGIVYDSDRIILISKYLIETNTSKYDA